MDLHPVLREKLETGGRAPDLTGITRRDVRLPPVADKIHTVIGMRRVGKSTYLRQVQAERTAQGGPATVYVGFDDDRLADLGADQLDAMVEEYYRQFPQHRGKERVLWLLDEIQVVRGWERFARRLMDTERVEIAVSGSSAKLLSREVHTSLRGRGWETVIRPFGFRECLRHHRSEPRQPVRRMTAPERSALEKRFREYLVRGGFPEAQGMEEAMRVTLVQGYVDTLLLRDVAERHQVSQIAALRWLSRQCLRNPAGLLSVHALYKDLKSQGHGVSKDTLHAFFEYLRDSFLISAVPLATDSERRRNSNPRKIYPADPAMIGAFDRSGRANLGHALETVVWSELDRRKADVGYVRTTEGFEVDFHARFPEGAEALIQVCADVRNKSVLEREARALAAAAREFPRARRLLLVLNRDQIVPLPEAKVRILPAYEWLLDDVNPK